MKITIYELLGLVKDGKAPKKIKFMSSIWEYCKDGIARDYINDYDKCLMEFIAINEDGLNDEVEILDEPKNNFKGRKMYQNGKVIFSMDCSVDETKDNSIERLDIEENGMNRNERYIRKEDNKFVNLSVADYELAKKINELIYEINNLKENK